MDKQIKNNIDSLKAELKKQKNNMAEVQKTIATLEDTLYKNKENEVSEYLKLDKLKTDKKEIILKVQILYKFVLIEYEKGLIEFIVLNGGKYKDTPLRYKKIQKELAVFLEIDEDDEMKLSIYGDKLSLRGHYFTENDLYTNCIYRDFQTYDNIEYYFVLNSSNYLTRPSNKLKDVNIAIKKYKKYLKECKNLNDEVVKKYEKIRTDINIYNCVLPSLPYIPATHKIFTQDRQ